MSPSFIAIERVNPAPVQCTCNSLKEFEIFMIWWSGKSMNSFAAFNYQQCVDLLAGTLFSAKYVHNILTFLQCQWSILPMLTPSTKLWDFFPSRFSTARSISADALSYMCTSIPLRICLNRSVVWYFCKRCPMMHTQYLFELEFCSH